MPIDHDLSTGECPVSHGARRNAAPGHPTNADWWPDQLNLKFLHPQSPLADPMDKDFNYAEAFKSLDLNAVIKDLHAVMTASQVCAIIFGDPLIMPPTSLVNIRTAMSTTS